MADFAIRVDKLSKRYQIGERERYWALRDVLTRAFAGRFRRLTRNSKSESQKANSEYIWALKDLCFEVKPGEVVGIIGRNGAGKSTLLKILSRVTVPTEGRAEIYGRVASLLEVGTGFHPELTGRENMYLNGAILGMKKQETDLKFDEIVAFAELDKFIDTPVKHYSSGMYVRLAFAVAAHLEPDILLVDEVLAVGDAAFQKKCLGKMGDVAKKGRTVLFVSHNMAAVLSLSNKAYLVDEGRITCEGTADLVVNKYIQKASFLRAVPLHERIDRGGDKSVLLTSLKIDSGSGNASIRCGDRVRIKIDYTATTPLKRASFLVGIYDQFNRPIFFLDSAAVGGLPEVLPASGSVTCITGPINLTPGPCIVNIAVLLGGTIADHVAYVEAFEVEPDDFYGTGKVTDRQTALCLLPQLWCLGS